LGKPVLKLRFEDILSSPHESVARLCDFVGLDFDDDMLPQPHHRLPLGTRFEEKWHPLRPEVNRQYLARLTEEHIEVIAARCEAIARDLGYPRPRSCSSDG